MSDKPICFVIQPFCEPYLKRFNEIYKLAIEAAGCVAQRAGEAGSDIITKEIRDNIRKADVCFADISLDNPNVWYEVGFAHACGKQITMVCNTDVRKLSDLPFDVKTRHVIDYTDYVKNDENAREGLRSRISKDIVEKLKKSKSSPAIPSTTKNTATKKDAPVLEHDEKIMMYIILYDMESDRPMDIDLLKERCQSSFSDGSRALAIIGLKNKGMIEEKETTPHDFADYTIPMLKLTKKGKQWYSDNIESVKSYIKKIDDSEGYYDDVPF